MKLLALDTSSNLCSVALALPGALLVREQMAAGSHGTCLLPMIDALLQEGAIALGDLDAIAFGRGPGGFTGVRMGVGVAQGLSLASGVPLIGVSDLQVVARHMLPASGPGRCLVCLDARMSELYWAAFEERDGSLVAVSAETVSAPAAVQLPAAWLKAPYVAAGSGFAAFAGLASSLPNPPQRVDSTYLPHAREVASLALAAGLAAAVSAEHAAPVYVRDRVAVKPGH